MAQTSSIPLKPLPPDPGVSAETAGKFRPDIQALRALAASAVVLYHFWPRWVPGGYVGVDIFFVISGFLITSHLVKEISQTGGLKFGRFYARRIRRLLPAALLVLAVTVVLIYSFFPQGFWAQYFKEVIGSTFYVENWVLAADSVDYLAAENAPSPAQHYWSLSVEEQFYLVWPVLLVGAFWAAGKLGTSWRRSLSVTLATVLGASLAASVIVTYWGPASQSYFATYTRAWQFAAGGLLAITGAAFALTAWRAKMVSLLGWLLLAASIFLFNSGTPFPGIAAAVPVAGAALVIWAGTATSDATVTPWVKWRWVNELGASSYSLYLWHWPLLLVLPFLLPQHLPAVVQVVAKTGMLALTIILAMLTRRWVEDPVRFNSVLAAKPSRSFLAALLAMVLVGSAAAVGLFSTQNSSARGAAEADQLLAANTACFGAGSSLATNQPCINNDLATVLLPQPAARLDDVSGAYSCYDSAPSADLPNCTEGSTRRDALRVAITGDSHAASLLPGLRRMWKQLNWKVDVFVGRGCVWRDTADESDCGGWRDSLRRRFESGPKYDLIIVTAAHHTVAPGSAPSLSRDYAAAWRPVLKRGTQIIAVADNPAVPDGAFSCIERSSSLATASACSFAPPQGWPQPDPLIEAVRIAGKNAHLIDMTDAYCTATTCPMVIGNVIAYRDQHHITATFSKTLAPYLAERMTTALRKA